MSIWAFFLTALRLAVHNTPAKHLLTGTQAIWSPLMITWVNWLSLSGPMRHYYPIERVPYFKIPETTIPVPYTQKFSWMSNSSSAFSEPIICSY